MLNYDTFMHKNIINISSQKTLYCNGSIVEAFYF